MQSNDFEAAFDRFLEQTEYDAAEAAVFSLVRAAFLAAGVPQTAARAHWHACLRCCARSRPIKRRKCGCAKTKSTGSKIALLRWCIFGRR